MILKEILLMVSVLMPGQTPDINKAIRQDSIEECWKAAAEFVNHDLTPAMREAGALGYQAGCRAVERPSADN